MQAKIMPQGDPFAAQTSTTASIRIGLIDLIRNGLTLELVQQAVKSVNLTVKDLADYGVIPARTLTHSQQSGKFSAVQSDRLARFFRIFRLACDTFGQLEKATVWLNRSTRALSGHKPVELLDTEEGARLIEDLLHRINHGLTA